MFKHHIVAVRVVLSSLKQLLLSSVSVHDDTTVDRLNNITHLLNESPTGLTMILVASSLMSY